MHLLAQAVSSLVFISFKKFFILSFSLIHTIDLTLCMCGCQQHDNVVVTVISPNSSASHSGASQKW